MKKTYNTPEIEVIKFSFDEIMANVNTSDPETFETSGYDVDL